MKYQLRIIPIISLFLLLVPLTGMAGERQQYITMHIPQSIIRQTLAEITPLSVKTSSKNLEGTIIITRITKLKLEQNRIFAHVKLRGENLNLITQVAGQNIRLQLGRAEVEIDCQVLVRYNAREKKLFLRPVANTIDPAKALKKGDVGESLLALFNNKEFPVTIQELKPIIAKTADTSFIIQTRIRDIRVIKQAIQVLFTPKITRKMSGK